MSLSARPHPIITCDKIKIFTSWSLFAPTITVAKNRERDWFSKMCTSYIEKLLTDEKIKNDFYVNGSLDTDDLDMKLSRCSNRL